MKTVIEMAINAGIEITYEYEDGDLELSGDKKALERFAEIVRADERNRVWTQEDWTEYEYSIAAVENEACAKLADLVAREIDDTNGTATYIGAVIRARMKR